MYLEDLEQVLVLEPIIFGVHHWTRENFTDELNHNLTNMMVAEEDGKIVGYAGSWVVVDEMHIPTIGVDPEKRRQGIGEAMLVALIDYAIKESVMGITLEVRASNIAAQKLYEKYRFHQQGVRKEYYKDNKEDALLLWSENIQDQSFKDFFNEKVEDLKHEKAVSG